MAPELSSNWKKLQAKIQSESTTSASPKAEATSSARKGTAKRKANGGDATSHSKRQKLGPKTPSQQPSPKSSNPKPQSSHPKSHPKPPTTTRPMGITQSSVLTKGTSATITPSLALWAEDNDISPEDLAEAYNLGPKPARTTNNDTHPLTSTTPSASVVSEQAARVNEGLAPNAEVGKYIALDCEMVGVGPDGHDHALARVSAVDFHGRQVYDAFVRPRERVTDYRTAITGITSRTLSGARGFPEVQAAVAALLRGRVVVGHDIRHDLAALQLGHPAPQVRDTARFAGYRSYGHGPKPALRVLAREVLGVEIQTGAHSSVEDARVAMLLFRRRKAEFDVEHANKYGLPKGAEEDGMTAATGVGGIVKAKPKVVKGKKKKKKR